ncbi:Gp37-like protein [Plantactinospora sp. WMMB782]|uniref:Gp37-like protein n=1 Tax=Plantactinospora sp. WMMB782 TaxID=3404121 RepID=UPI003B92E355
MGDLMRPADLTVEVRDATRARVGQIRPDDLDITVTDTLNGVGTWSLKLPVEHPMVPTLRTPGSGLVITGPDGETLLSGPTVTPESAVTSEDPIGIVAIKGVSDAIHMADRLAVPNPNFAELDAEGDLYDVRTNFVEHLMYHYVSVNLGPDAPAVRRVAGLSLGASEGRGPVVTRRVRYEKVGEVLAGLAQGTGLYWRMRQVGTDIRFDVHESVDRRDSIRLDVLNNTLAGHRVSTSPPGATRVLVAGKIDDEPDDSGNELRRVLKEVSTTESVAAEAAWGRRIERFVDKRSIEDEDELLQAGAEVLAEEGFAAISVQVVPMDDSSMEFLRDWFYGDLVKVVVDGEELEATVTGYVLKANASGTSVGVVLGDPSGLSAATALERRLADSENRISALERGTEKAQGIRVLTPGGYEQSTAAEDYPQGESLLHLTDEQAEDAGWDFWADSASGTVRTVRPLGEAGDAYQTWTSHDGEGGWPVMMFRSGTAEDGWTDWHSLLTYADLSEWEAERQLATDWNGPDDEPEWYPSGTSLMATEAGGDWTPNGGNGMVVTHHLEDERVTQVFHAASGPGMWVRNHHADNPGWSDWAEVHTITEAGRPIEVESWAEFNGLANTAPAAGTTPVNITFVAPPSGKVYVTVSGNVRQSINGNQTVLSCDVRAGTTPGAGTAVITADYRRGIVTNAGVVSAGPAYAAGSRRFLVSGLTPGASYTAQTYHWVTPAGTGQVYARSLSIEPVP